MGEVLIYIGVCFITGAAIGAGLAVGWRIVGGADFWIGIVVQKAARAADRN